MDLRILKIIDLELKYYVRKLKRPRIWWRPPDLVETRFGGDPIWWRPHLFDFI